MRVGSCVDEIGEVSVGRTKFGGWGALGLDAGFIRAQQDIQRRAAPGSVDAEDSLVLASQSARSVGAEGAAAGAAFASAEGDDCGAI